MAVALRTPHYLSYTNSTSSITYAIITLGINGSTAYTIRKDKDSNDRVIFDIATLAKDYHTFEVEPEHGKTITATTISTSLQWYTSAGVASGSAITAVNYGYYGYYKIGSNNFLGANDVLGQTNTTVYLPENTTSEIPFWGYQTPSTSRQTSVGATDTSVNVAGTSITIKRLDCSKYDAIEIIFINRFGMYQPLYFDKKSIGSFNSKKEMYRRSFSPTSGGGGFDYNYQGEEQVLSVNGENSLVLNTGYVDEGMNEVFKELMLSENVWIDTGSGTFVSCNITTSSTTFKKSVNDKLINLTIEVKLSNKEIKLF